MPFGIEAIAVRENPRGVGGAQQVGDSDDEDHRGCRPLFLRCFSMPVITHVQSSSSGSASGESKPITVCMITYKPKRNGMPIKMRIRMAP